MPLQSPDPIKSPALDSDAVIVFIAGLSSKVIIYISMLTSIAFVAYVIAWLISPSIRHHNSCSWHNSHLRSCSSCNHVCLVANLHVGFVITSIFDRHLQTNLALSSLTIFVESFWRARNHFVWCSCLPFAIRRCCRSFSQKPPSSCQFPLAVACGRHFSKQRAGSSPVYRSCLPFLNHRHCRSLSIQPSPSWKSAFIVCDCHYSKQTYLQLLRSELVPASTIDVSIGADLVREYLKAAVCSFAWIDSFHLCTSIIPRHLLHSTPMFSLLIL